MKTSRTSSLNWALLLLLSFGCQSAPQPTPQDEDPTAILDAPIPESQRPKPTASLTEAMMLLPETPKKPAIELDAKDSEWNGKKFRKFDSKSSVQEGLQYWTGKKDGSMRVAVDADEGFLYVYIDVVDDHVIDTPEGETPTDGVVLWLRDPGLDSLGDALPPNVGLDEYVDAETAILFLPNGRVEVYDGRQELSFNDVLQHESSQTKRGYTIEAALKLEAFGEISSIPLPEIAFRVEQLDGDDEDRRGHQTLLSTTPDRGVDAPRMAIFTAGGLLPHVAVGATPPRINAIGRWKVEDKKWNFVSFEVVPKYWATLEDTQAFEEALKKSKSMKDLCGTARKDVQLVEAYQSRGGSFRAGLVMCGQRTVKDKCPADAESNLFVVTLQPEDDTWRVVKAVNVFDEPSKQCTNDPVKEEPFYSHLSFYPLDILSANVWVVGWTRSLDTPEEVEEAYGVTLLNTDYDVPHLGTTLTRSTKLTANERTISTSSVYLTYVDKDDDVDICQVEDFVEQACEGFDRGCVTYEHGHTVLTSIQMWSKKKRKFERYELSKHPGCTSSFDFSEARGYLFLQLKDRIGLLPSPESNSGADTEKLDIF